MTAWFQRPEAIEAASSALLEALAVAITPPPQISISDWAERTIVISGETGSSRPGPFSWEGFEHFKEPLDRLHPDDTARSVTIKGSAQTGKTTIGVIATLFFSTQAPRPWCVALPTLDEARKYNREKWQPIVDASPIARAALAPVKSRDELASTTSFKRFAGGKGSFVNASSPNPLQMVSLAFLVLEETANYPADVGGRGSPIGQLEKRQLAWELAGAKTLHVSTPGYEGLCPVTAHYEAGDQRQAYVPCPHCGTRQRLDFERMKGLDPVASGEKPKPFFVCPACSGRIEHRHQAGMRRQTVWVPTFRSEDPENPAPEWWFAAEELARWRQRPTEGRQPSYHVWQVLSSMVDWAYIAADYAKAKAGGQAAWTTFAQQTLGEAVKVEIEGLALDTLREKKTRQARGIVPAGGYMLFGAIDLNGDFAEWAVWAFGAGLESWLVDTGQVLGGPDDSALWRELTRIVGRRWPHAEGGELGVDGWVCDSGYGTANVYAFCSRHAGVRATKGQDGWGLPPMKRGPMQRAQGPDGTIARARLWTIGTWDLKRLLYECLAVTAQEGPGAGIARKLHVPDWALVDEHGNLTNAWLESLTAETLVQRTNDKTGEVLKEQWKRIRRRNEQLDLWVLCAAQAKSRGVGVPGAEPDWFALAARVSEARQLDLLDDVTRPGGAPMTPAPQAAGGASPPAAAPDLAALYRAANGEDER